MQPSSALAYLSFFHDLLSQSYVWHSVWSVITADNFTPAKRDGRQRDRATMRD